ncbi:MAG: hypothetical protein MUE73_09785 [Planctomycetes bacterium]|jgi:hypothetical protein|nr:hypothetical protein [Planctomycetota bacterium]
MKKTLFVLFLACAAALSPAGAEEQVSTEDEVLARMVEPVVFLRYVLKVQVTMGGQSREQERSMEVAGVMVTGEGLVMTANSNFDPSGSLPRGMRGEVQIKGTPADIKILFGNEEEEYEAQLAAVDSVLGLAYVQILDLKDRKPKHVDLAPAAVPALGDDLLSFGRLSREFDCAPVLGRMYVRGKVEKPREMWVVSGEGAAPGLPIFAADLRPVGVMVLQSGSSGVEGGGGNRPFLLPLTSVERSLKAAREKAGELLAKPAPAEEKPAEEPKPADEGE